jgi:hypothetical protein
VACVGFQSACSDTQPCCTGTLCQSGSCCADQGQGCTQDSDCCGGSCTNGICQTLCAIGNSCGEAELCCTGQRCFRGGCCIDDFQTCTQDADCCSGSCVGGACTQGCNDAFDGCGTPGSRPCCSGLSCSLNNTCCRDPGQACTFTNECCTGVCTNGFCPNGGTTGNVP